MAKLHVIDTGFFKLDGGAMFGVVPKSLWNKLNPADENNMCTWAMRCLLVESDDRLILIDTGIGSKQSEKFFSHFYLHGSDSLLNSITNKGFTAEQITDVFLTHLHFDHVGGAVYQSADSSYALTFPNATHWVNEIQWQNAMKPNAREKASFLIENLQPILDSGKLSFLPKKSPFKDLEYIQVDGHTLGMMLPIIKTESCKVIYLADLIPSSAHIALPYVMSYDMQPILTLQEKENILIFAEENKCILFFEHDPMVEAATIVLTDKGLKIKNTGKLSEILTSERC